ncbi:hypothetical protein PR048_021414 [Dryococelus australis]|uniref:Uncharacterized protein n=1 Tax=Dryococelus australis TaxID=614101 RepID=A0ABQ9GY46_9NEOP|nr:hypothetical protein PR048_021414 [Dryococelus australis]
MPLKISKLRCNPWGGLGNSTTIRVTQVVEEAGGDVICSCEAILMVPMKPKTKTCSPLIKAIRVQSPAGSLWIFACGNRAGRCRWPAGLLVDLSFSPSFNSGAAPCSPQSPSSAPKTSMLTAVQISSLITRCSSGSSSIANVAQSPELPTLIKSWLGGLLLLNSIAGLDHVRRTPSNAERNLVVKLEPSADLICRMFNMLKARTMRTTKGLSWQYATAGLCDVGFVNTVRVSHYNSLLYTLFSFSRDAKQLHVYFHAIMSVANKFQSFVVRGGKTYLYLFTPGRNSEYRQRQIAAAVTSGPDTGSRSATSSFRSKVGDTHAVDSLSYLTTQLDIADAQRKEIKGGGEILLYTGCLADQQDNRAWEAGVPRETLDRRSGRRGAIATAPPLPQCNNVGETEDPRENAPASGIVLHDSHVRKSRNGPSGDWTQFAKGEKKKGGDPRTHGQTADRRLEPRSSRRRVQGLSPCATSLGVNVELIQLPMQHCTRLYNHTPPPNPQPLTTHKHPANHHAPLPRHPPGATVAKLLARSPLTKANRIQSPAGSPDFRKWESCRAMPLVGGSSRRSPVFLSFRCRSIFTSITRIGSQDLAVKSRPSIFTHFTHSPPSPHHHRPHLTTPSSSSQRPHIAHSTSLHSSNSLLTAYLPSGWSGTGRQPACSPLCSQKHADMTHRVAARASSTAAF